MGLASTKYIAVDLFCGGGGFSRGFALACENLGIKNIRLIAINHWKAAVETHKVNHPWAEHHCARIDQLDPRKLVPEGRMKILIASPECTNHANARGGRPMNDQSRATAWDVVKWAQELYIESILIENVREIMQWGPLGADGRPMKSRKGETFKAWLEAIHSCGYTVEHRILNAADYGGATTRQRFFLIARRAPNKIVWPKPTHSKRKEGELDFGMKPWRAAREIIDWSLKGKSIFHRKRPLAKNTLARIEAGLRKFCGPAAEPFIVALRGTTEDQINASVKSVSQPLPTILANGTHLGLAEPFIVTPGGADIGIGRPVSQPLPTVLCHERFALVEPFILQQQSGGAPRSTEQPLPSIAAKGAQAIVQPFIVPFFGEAPEQKPRTHDINEPLPAVTSHGAGALIEPFVVQVNHGTNEKTSNNGRVRSVDEPLSTVTRENGHALVEPFLVKYNGTAMANTVRDPMPTVTGKDRLALVEPQGSMRVDILFRMLEPNELARAMGFEGYEFKGPKKDRIKMIGNAVEVQTAKALCTAILRTITPTEVGA